MLPINVFAYICIFECWKTAKMAVIREKVMKIIKSSAQLQLGKKSRRKLFKMRGNTLIWEPPIIVPKLFQVSGHKILSYFFGRYHSSLSSLLDTSSFLIFFFQISHWKTLYFILYFIELASVIWSLLNAMILITWLIYISGS